MRKLTIDSGQLTAKYRENVVVLAVNYQLSTVNLLNAIWLEL